MPLVVLGGWLAVFMFSNLIAIRIEKSAENSLDYKAAMLKLLARRTGQIHAEQATTLTDMPVQAAA